MKKNLYTSLRADIRIAFDEKRKTLKYTYQSVKKELKYHEYVRDLKLGTLNDFENLIGGELQDDNYYNYWK